MPTITMHVASATIFARGKERRTVTFPNGDSQDWTVGQLRRRGYDGSGELTANISEDLNERGQHVLTYPSGWVSRWSPETVETRSTVPTTESGDVGVAEVAAPTEQEVAQATTEDDTSDVTTGGETTEDTTIDVDTEVEFDLQPVDAGAAQAILRGLFGIGESESTELFSIVLPDGYRLTVSKEG